MISKRTIFVSLSFLLLVGAMSYVVSVTAAGNRPSANGHGNLTIGGELRTFSFHASTDKNGNVSGSATVNNRSADIRSQISIDCISVSGNMATMSGRITRSTDANEGAPAFFRVIDNGEGANAPTDQMTLVFFNPAPNAPPYDCTGSFNVGFGNIEGGNIQVKP